MATTTKIEDLSPEDLQLYSEATKLQQELIAGTSTLNKLSEKHKKILEQTGTLMEQNSKYYQDQVDNINRYINFLETRAGLEKDYTEILAQNRRLKQAEIAIEEEKIRAANKFLNEYENKYNETLERRDKLIEEQKKKQVLINKLIKQANALEAAGEKKEAAAFSAKAAALRQAAAAKLATAETLLKTHEEDHAVAIKNLETATETRDIKQDESDISDGIESGVKGILKTFLGLQDQSKSFLGSLLKSYDQTKSWKDTIEKVQGIWKGLANPLNAVVAVIGAIALSTLAWMKEFDTASAEFRKSTGIMEDGLRGIEHQVNLVQRANLAYGVSTKEAFAATQSLATEMRQFRKMSKGDRASLMQTTAIMGELGASTQTTAAIFNTFQKGLGYNAKQLESLGGELVAISKSLGRPLQEVTEDFKAGMPELMKYGDGMKDVFAGLAEQSAETGLAMSELLGIAKQFDTFEDAGTAVGRLNAILGGPYLNAIQMVYATEEERIQAMRDSMKDSGRRFKDLDRFEKQAIAAAAGIKDMAVAEQLFGSTDAEYAERTMEMKDMAARAKEAQAVQEKFAQAMTAMAIAAAPLVDVLTALADVLLFMLQPFSSLTDEWGPEVVGWLNTLVPLIWLSVVAWKAHNIAIIKMAAPILAGVAAFMLMKKAFDWLLDATGPITTAIASLTIGFAALAAAKAWAGGPFLIAGWAIAAGVAVAAAASLVASLDALAVGADDWKGGPALVGEKGPELITTKGGGASLATGPQVVDLPEGSNVITNKNTKDIMSGRAGAKGGAAGGGGIPPELITSLRQLQASIEILNQSITAEQQPAAPEDEGKQLIIEMDGKKVADAVIARINKKSRLTISKAG